MPRSARLLLPGHIYHLTHRCHNGSFFLRFDSTRTAYRQRMWEMARKFAMTILNYCITSNHTHQIVIVRRPALISTFMHHLEGQFALHYNRCKDRRGAFWSERYHATLIENGRHFWNCMHYIDLNMVRAGVVAHPMEWPWCGYQEIAFLRRRYRILDLKELMRLREMNDPTAFSARYSFELAQMLKTANNRRQPYWSESIAVGSKIFVNDVAATVKNRKRLVIREWDNDAWYLRDQEASYETHGDSAESKRP